MPARRRFGSFGALLAGLLAATVWVSAAPAEATQRPFMLWTKQDAAAIRARIEREPWARAEYERMLAESQANEAARQYVRLFQASVMGDEKARASEKQYLLSFIGAPIGESRRHTMYLHALRYDIVYDDLTDSQREKIEQTIRKHVRYELDNPRQETRISWLPNMQWPRTIGAHLLAAALQDEKLIREIWASPTGFKWYLDEYLADGGFYFEEFAKMDGTAAEMLLFCRAAQRLGLDQLGFGYTGTGGATMLGHIQSLIRIGYPRTELADGLPHYGIVTMGDARGSAVEGAPPFLFHHAIVPGTVRGERQPLLDFFARNMQGRDHRGAKVAKFGRRHWFEIMHAQAPTAGFGYFLAQMRGRGQDRYYPTLFWGLDPIDPKDAPPPPAPSEVFRERGFAILRADESPAYWQSPAPAVALQFAKLYVHYTADCFSLLGFHAFNRPIYVNRTISAGYNGGPWDFHVRGHCGVVVDGLQAQPIGIVPTRHQFEPPVKFVLATTVDAKPLYTGQREVRSSDQPREPAQKVYPGVDLTRGLMLTREYLFDVYHVKADGPRHIHWLVHAPGSARPEPGQRWADSTDLRHSPLLNIPEIAVTGEKRFEPGPHGWSLPLRQTCAIDPDNSAMGRAWYDRQVGVTVSMLGEPGTRVFSFDTPQVYTPGSPRTPRPDDPRWTMTLELGGVSLAVERKSSETLFVALHEPFERGQHRITGFERIAQTDHAVAVRVLGSDGSPVNDRLMMRFDNRPDAPVTLDGDGESFTFAGHGYIRVGESEVIATGPIRAMKLRVSGAPKLLLNGQPTPARLANGLLEFNATGD